MQFTHSQLKGGSCYDVAIVEEWANIMTNEESPLQSNSDQEEYWNSSAGKKWVEFQDERI